MTPPVETQPERTALAWQRTGLGILAIAGLLAHDALREGEALLLVLAGVAALLGLGVLGGLAPVRYRALRHPAAASRLVGLVTAAVLVVAALAAVAVLS